ncbi:hypothetical protein E4T42_08447 [Aureobasidium subglaciale]|nr:hypothetical protein E4T42_08447 [Aureobasidium subglaciale]
MDSSTRKHAAFIRPDGVEVIDVEDEPEKDTPATDYEHEKPIKQESGESEPKQPGAQPTEDINDFLDGSIAPYADGPSEPDSQTGAKRDPSRMTVTSTLGTSITTAGLGTSMLQPPKSFVPQKKQSEAELAALHALQTAFFEQYAASGGYDLEIEDNNEPEEEFVSPIAFEATFLNERKAFVQKKVLGKATQHEELAFMKLESRYNKEKRALEDAIEAAEDPLFVPEEPQSSKRKRASAESTSDSESKDMASRKKRSKKAKSTRKSRKASRGDISLLDLEGTTNNFWENAEAAQQMNDEATVQGGADRTKALAAMKRNLPAESRAAAVRDAERLTAAMKSFTAKKSAGPNRTHRSIVTTDAGWLVKGMKTPLKHYQLISAGWMRSREGSESSVTGGIVADQMGLGKTVTCIANIVNGRPLKAQAASTVSSSHTTLIVVPSSLLGQWQSELELHTVEEKKRRDWGLGPVTVFKDSSSADSVPANFDLFDIVLTTYYDVRKSWPICVFPEGLPEAEHEAFWMENYWEKRGPLHKFPFLRVVLDEGHVISNPETQISQACFNLVAPYRWILTGTPMINGAKDFYSLLAFIDHPTAVAATFESFKSRFCNPKNPMSLSGLTRLITPYIICWTHKHSFMNAKLTTLPPPRDLSLRLKPDILEFEIYEVVRNRFKMRAETLDENGDPRSSSFHIFAMFALLRQLTAHPLMIPNKICDYLEMEDFDILEKAVERQIDSGNTGNSLIHAFKNLMQKQRAVAQQRMADGLKPVREGSETTLDEFDEDPDEIEQLNQPKQIKKNNKKRGTGAGHGKDVDYNGVMETLKRSTNYHISHKRSTCCKCNRPAHEAVMTSCFHFYCHLHLEDIMHAAAEAGEDQATCIREGCGKKIVKSLVIDPTAPVKPKWLAADGNVIPSTKTLAVKSLILSWLERDPECKIIVFMQWRAFLGLLSRICEVEGWGYTTLHGGLNKKQKDANIAKFKDLADTKILLATLKTGGVGLNLTCANFVVNVDPYWNTAAEVQAFSRVYRIGQEKQTEFVNLTLEGTIDEHLNGIKHRKKLEIDRVNVGCRKLSNKEMLKVFEPVRQSTEDSDSG